MTAGAPALPGLRQELRLTRGAAQTNGAPSWTLFDPLRHSFFRLGEVEFILFKGWSNGSLGESAQQLRAKGLGAAETDRAFAEVVEFALRHQLTERPQGDATASYMKMHRARQRSWWKLLLDNYLFFRVPLVRPADFLARTLPLVEPLYSRAALTFFVVLACVNLFFVARHFDEFWSTFLDFLSLDGLLFYALGLSAVKIVHELGHAYTVTRFGARVPTMGVSFLLLFPVLYTDTTGAWGIASRRQRLAVDIAGVTAELMCAVLCTTAWLLLPDGPLRSVAFVLATSSWVLSVAININPFMRFDGYYVLSDWLNVPNLQARAFELQSWALRRWVWGLDDPPPEQLAPRLRNGLIVYAALSALYRLFLFGGIALILYLTLFKPLGLILAAVEIGVFIARPVVMELRSWWQRRADIVRQPRGRWLLLGAGAGLLLMALPLDRSVTAPAVLAPTAVQPLVAGSPARIERVAVRTGDQVRSGQILLELRAPDIARTEAAHRARIAAIADRLARSPSNLDDLSSRAVLERELAAEQAALASLSARSGRLVLRAAFDGVVAELTPDVHVGRWVSGSELLGQLVRPGARDVTAFVEEQDARRIHAEARATFVPDDALGASHAARLRELSTAALQQLDQPMLASVHGGPIAVREEQDGRLRPEQALYRAQFQVAQSRVAGNSRWLRPVTGQVSIAAEGESMLGRFLRWTLRLVRSEGALF